MSLFRILFFLSSSNVFIFSLSYSISSPVSIILSMTLLPCLHYFISLYTLLPCQFLSLPHVTSLHSSNVIFWTQTCNQSCNDLLTAGSLYILLLQTVTSFHISLAVYGQELWMAPGHSGAPSLTL